MTTHTTHWSNDLRAPQTFWGEVQAGADVTLPERCDDLIVGAGITGLATALLLARAGRHVCVLEARRPGAGATGRTTGKVSLLQGVRLSTIAETHSLHVAAQYLAANRRGQEWLGEFCDTNGVPLQTRSAVTTAGAADDAWRVGREHLVTRSLGLPVTWEEHHPDLPSWGATRLAQQFQLDPVRLVDALTRAVQRAGGLVVRDARVRTLGRSGTEVTLDDGRHVRARTVTVASGAPVVGDPFAFTRLRPARSYLIAYRHPAPPADMVLSIGQQTRSLRPAVDTRGEPVLLVGGEGHAVGRVDEAQRLEELRRWTAGHFPDAHETHAWSAQDHGTTTGLPLVGRAERHREVRIATGFDKWGLTNGPAAALALADDILGVRPTGRAKHYLAGRRRPLGWTASNLVTGVQPVKDAAAVARGRPTAPAPRDLACLRGVCTHMGGLLRWNTAEETWDCPLHGSRFAADGTVLEGPATRAARVPRRPGDA